MIATENEFLLQQRSIGLAEGEAEISRLKAELEVVKQERDMWQEFAGIGLAEVVKRWMKSEVWQKACKPSAKEKAKVYKALIESTRQFFISGGH